MATLYRFREYHPISSKVKQEAIPKRICGQSSLIDTVENQRGQAIVENILMLVVVVTLIMASRFVFKSVNDFMSDYMGSYIVCLMEYGELPSLGVENDDLKKHEGTDGGQKCTFRTVASAGGTGGTGSTGSTGGPASGGPGSSGSGSSGSKSGSKTSSNNSSSNSSNGKSSSQNSKSGSDGDASAGSGGRGRSSSVASHSPYRNGTLTRSGGFSTADNPQDLNDGKVKVIDAKSEGGESGAGDSERRRSKRSGSGLNGSGNYKAITGGEAEIEKSTRREIHKGGSRVVASSDEGYRFMPLKRTISPPEFKPPAEEKKEEGFNLGNFMKWIIIAGMVIAVVLFFGGQVLGYSNSDN